MRTQNLSPIFSPLICLSHSQDLLPFFYKLSTFHPLNYTNQMLIFQWHEFLQYLWFLLLNLQGQVALTLPISPFKIQSVYQLKVCPSHERSHSGWNFSIMKKGLDLTLVHQILFQSCQQLPYLAKELQVKLDRLARVNITLI